jgi:hypothetical protein
MIDRRPRDAGPGTHPTARDAPGGATMPGPPPKPDSERVRRNAVVSMTRLPAVTLTDPPAWPLPAPVVPGVDPELAEAEIEQLVERELEAWAELWKLPQATVWHQQRAARLVARYVRFLVRAEDGSLEAGRECRLLERGLLLNTITLAQARYTIDEDELSARREPELAAVVTPAAKKAGASRRRLAVDKRGASAAG